MTAGMKLTSSMVHEVRTFFGRLGTLTRYVATLRNWPQVAALHFSLPSVKPADVLRLRDGQVIYMLDAEAEIRAFQSVYLHRCYDRDFGPIPRSGNVIDLGANVGIFALYAATRLVPEGRVLAVEANPACVANLRRTAQACCNITILEGAVGGSGTLWLSTNSLGASIYRDSRSMRGVETATLLPARLLHYFDKVELLKINIEGAEYPFLLDTSDELLSGVRRVAVKWHKGEIAEGRHPDELARRLQNLGFSIRRHQDIWSTPTLTTGITTAKR